jgi:hypothetical protein
LPGITRSEVRRRGVVGGDGRKRPGSAGAVGKTQLTSGACLIERQGRGGRLRKTRTEKENVFLVKTRPMRGLDGPAGTISACGDDAVGGRAIEHMPSTYLLRFDWSFRFARPFADYMLS